MKVAIYWHTICICIGRLNVLTRQHGMARRELSLWTIAVTIGLIVACAALVVAIDATFVRRMAMHIVLMSVIAPLIVLIVVQGGVRQRSAGGGALLLATVAQVVLLYLWHLPLLHDVAVASLPVRLLMHASLGLVAAGFWYAILARPGSARWSAVAALLVTGKLFCLLGVLLVFARRPLLSMDGALIALDEQQLAGLLMLGACPLTYLGAAFVLTCSGIRELALAPSGRPELSG